MRICRERETQRKRDIETEREKKKETGGKIQTKRYSNRDRDYEIEKCI